MTALSPPAAGRADEPAGDDGAGTASPPGSPAARWDDALLAAALFAVDPIGVGGIRVQSMAGPVRDRWIAAVRALLPPRVPFRRVPLHVTDGRLLGGLDLAATLQAGRPVAERGLLAEADGGVVLLAMAERIAAATAARITAALDDGEVAIERDGLGLRVPTRFGVVAFDEGDHDEAPPAGLRERLGFHIDLRAIGTRDAPALGARDAAALRRRVAGARRRLGRVTLDDGVAPALCAAALALGIGSLRAPQLALRAARAAAALAGREAVDAEDARAAARLVFGARATQLPEDPAPDDAEPLPPEPPAPAQDADPSDDDPRRERSEPDRPLEDRVLAAAKAAIPPDLLARLTRAARTLRSRAGGRAGAARATGLRGRPAGIRRGEPGPGARLSVVETLRAAAPWQPLRRASQRASATAPRVHVRPDDFRVVKLKQRTRTTTVFVVDASGSAALHRLAEAKGAVELLLADCYVRRDQVAMIAFRGQSAQLLLPPTRSLVRAKRSLAGLPGGGGTPLGAGLAAAALLSDAIRRKGDTPVMVVLTDGKANVSRSGAPGRAAAEADAKDAARQVRLLELTCVLIDTAPRPQQAAQALADAMGALYLPLPHADAGTLNRAIRSVG